MSGLRPGRVWGYGGTESELRERAAPPWTINSPSG